MHKGNNNDRLKLKTNHAITKLPVSQGGGKLVLCGVLRSLIDFVVSSDGFIAWAEAEEAEAMLARLSWSSSLQISSSSVS